MNKEELIAQIAGLEIKGIEQLNVAEIKIIVKLNSDLQAAVQENEDLKAINEALNAQVSKSDSEPSGSKVILKFGKEKYELVVPVSTLDGKKIDKSTLKDNSKELEKLVKIKSGIIQKVN